MTDNGSYCPVQLTTEVLADRWTPLIVREMILGTTRFNDLVRALPGISRTLLTQRLRHLERHGVLEAWPSPTGRGSEYHLTPAGRDLEGVLMAVGEWTVRWMFTEPEPRNVDPVALTWWMSRRLVPDEVPDDRTVVQFDYAGERPTRIWIVLERKDASVCTEPPGFDSDVVVSTDPVALMRVFSGITSYGAALESGDISLAGPPRLTRALPTWFAWSPFAPATRERLALD